MLIEVNVRLEEESWKGWLMFWCRISEYWFSLIKFKGSRVFHIFCNYFEDITFEHIAAKYPIRQSFGNTFCPISFVELQIVTGQRTIWPDSWAPSFYEILFVLRICFSLNCLFCARNTRIIKCLGSATLPHLQSNVDLEVVSSRSVHVNSNTRPFVINRNISHFPNQFPVLHNYHQATQWKIFN